MVGEVWNVPMLRGCAKTTSDAERIGGIFATALQAMSPCPTSFLSLDAIIIS